MKKTTVNINDIKLNNVVFNNKGIDVTPLQEMLEKEVTPVELAMVLDNISYELTEYMLTDDNRNGLENCEQEEGLYYLKMLRERLMQIILKQYENCS